MKSENPAEATEVGSIERDSPTPLYHQLEEIIRGRIRDGQYRVGEMLPSEHEFCGMFGLSRSVVRQTLQNLSQAGVLVTKPGRGRIVAEEKLSERFIQHTTGFHDDLSSQGIDVQTRIVRQEIAPVPPEAREFLGCDTAIRIDRVRSASGDVLMYVSSYVPAERCPGLEMVDLENQSLYRVLGDRYGLSIHSGHRTVEATAADAEIADMLETAEGSPVMVLVGRGSKQNGDPLEWFKSWHRSDRTRFEVELEPAGQESRSRPRLVTTAGPPNVEARSLRQPGQRNADGGTRSAWLNETERTRIIAVLRCPEFGPGDEIANSLAEGGISVVEFTLTASNAFDAIEQAAAGSSAMVGAGSVTTKEQCRRAIDAGAAFIVSPVRAGEIVAEAGPVPVILAGATPTEIYECHELTGGPVKVFPMGVGGPEMVRAIAAPLPQIPLMPSGGVTAENARDFLNAGAFALNVGSALAPPSALSMVDPDVLRTNAERFANLVDEGTPL